MYEGGGRNVDSSKVQWVLHLGGCQGLGGFYIPLTCAGILLRVVRDNHKPFTAWEDSYQGDGLVKTQSLDILPAAQLGMAHVAT